MGDSIATNLFMVGYAYQRGLLPLSEAAILKAIELNGTAVESNKRAFQLGTPGGGRSGEGCRGGRCPRELPDSQRLSDVARRDRSRAASKFLTDYQDAAYAKRYTDLVAQRAARPKRA